MLAGSEEFLLKISAKIREDASAVICHNDELAYRLKELLRKEKRSDIEVVSFDNSYYASTASRTTSFPRPLPGIQVIRPLFLSWRIHRQVHRSGMLLPEIPRL